MRWTCRYGLLAFEELFGPRPVELTLLLLIGRESGVSAADRRRLEWRSRHMPVHGHRIYVYTFDDLLRDLRRRLAAFQTYETYATGGHDGPRDSGHSRP